MGNLVVFRRRAGLISLDVANDQYPAASERKDRLEPPLSDFTLGRRDKKSISWGLPDVFRRFGLARFARAVVNASPASHPDAYLLVLLADQELTAGRDQQAQVLVDAAYAAFDQRAHCRSSNAARHG